MVTRYDFQNEEKLCSLAINFTSYMTKRFVDLVWLYYGSFPYGKLEIEIDLILVVSNRLFGNRVPIDCRSIAFFPQALW